MKRKKKQENQRITTGWPTSNQEQTPKKIKWRGRNDDDNDEKKILALQNRSTYILTERVHEVARIIKAKKMISNAHTISEVRDKDSKAFRDENWVIYKRPHI